jgi:hypothetical protein
VKRCGALRPGSCEVGATLHPWLDHEPTDHLDHNCRQQGFMKSRALVGRLMGFLRSRLGLYGCCTSLLYRGSSLPKRCTTVQ